MLNKLLAATAIVAMAYAVSPADAARVKAGCSGDNLSKTETMIENMADGEGKIAAQKEKDRIESLLGNNGYLVRDGRAFQKPDAPVVQNTNKNRVEVDVKFMK